MGFVLAHDHKIGEQVELAQCAPQPISLLDYIRYLWLNHQEIKVAVLPGFASCMRAKQDHARSWRRGLRQSPPSLLYQRLAEHTITVARHADRRFVRPQPLIVGTGASGEAAPLGEAGVPDGGSGFAGE
jgi:hypothetical protein